MTDAIRNAAATYEPLVRAATGSTLVADAALRTHLLDLLQ
jgi:hypothetical protein